MERWDPTEIIVQVFPIQDLNHFVLICCGLMIVLSTLMNVMMNTSSRMIKDKNYNIRYFIGSIVNYVYIQIMLFGIVLFSVILAGASPWIHIHHTIVSCIYFTFLLFGYFHKPKSLLRSRKRRIIDQILELLIYIFLGEKMSLDKDHTTIHEEETEDGNKIEDGEYTHGDDEDQINRYIMYSTILVAIPFQILNILDHGEQIQRWPMPIILGSTIGHCLGCSVGFIASCCNLWHFTSRWKKVE